MTFRTIRAQLLWNYILAIGTLVLASAAVAISVYSFSRRADELVYAPTELVRISAELNQVHQYMANFVNYDDPSYLERYRDALRDLATRLDAFEPTVRAISGDQNDVEFLYSYLEIQNQLTWYVQSGERLVEHVNDADEERFARFELLYELRDLRARIAAALTDLLFRQMNHTQATYDAHRLRLRNNWLVLFAIFAVTIVALIQFVVRQARAISEPIRELVAQGRQIASHDYRITPLSRTTNDELKTLSDTFVEMAAEIERSIEILNQKNMLERSNLEMRQSLKQAELELLQSQINPHFLFNTLNTVTSLARIENAPETEQLLSTFSRFLRFNLRSLSSVVSIERELEIVEAYLFIQKQRFGYRLTYHIEADDSVLSCVVPSLTIQPFVENSLMHGIEARRDGGSITIRAVRDDEVTCNLTISDTGVGMTGDQVQDIQTRIKTLGDEARDHMGIVNTMKRVRLYDPSARMEIESRAGVGTTISLRFRLQRVATTVAIH